MTYRPRLKHLIAAKVISNLLLSSHLRLPLPKPTWKRRRWQRERRHLGPCLHRPNSALIIVKLNPRSLLSL